MTRTDRLNALANRAMSLADAAAERYYVAVAEGRDSDMNRLDRRVFHFVRRSLRLRRSS